MLGNTYHFPATNYRRANTWRADGGIGWHGYVFRIPVSNGRNKTICVEMWDTSSWVTIGCQGPASGQWHIDISGSTSEGRWLGRLWQHGQGQVRSVTWYRTSNATSFAGSDFDTGIENWEAGTPNLTVSRTNSQNSNNVWTTAADLSWINSTLRGRARYAGTCAGITSSCPPLVWSGAAYSQNYMWINTVGPGMGAGSNRRRTIAHEFGHTLGMAHIPNPGSEVVMATFSTGLQAFSPQA